MSDDPSKQTWCPSCRARFDQPREQWVMTEQGPMTQVFCPACGYQYAQWPVAPTEVDQ